MVELNVSSYKTEAEALPSNQKSSKIINTKKGVYKPTPLASVGLQTVKLRSIAPQQQNTPAKPMISQLTTVSASFESQEELIDSGFHELLKMEARYQKKIPKTPSDIYLDKEQQKSKEKYESKLDKMFTAAISGGKWLLNKCILLISKSESLAELVPNPVGSMAVEVAANVAERVLQVDELKETADKKAEHERQMRKNLSVGSQVTKNYQTAKNLFTIRLAKVQEKKEVEQLFGLKKVDNNTLLNRQELVEIIKKNDQISKVQQKLTIGFLNNLKVNEKDTITFEDLQKQYTDHTLALSINARSGLMAINAQKNEQEKKFFTLKKTEEGWKFSISLTAGLSVLALNIASMSGTFVASHALLGAIGVVPLACEVGIAAIGLAVIAYRSPNQFKEFMKGTYVLKELYETRKGIYSFFTRYNKKTEKLEKQIKNLSTQLKSLKISESKFNRLEASEKHKYIPIIDDDGNHIYVVREEFHGKFRTLSKDLHDLKTEQARIKKRMKEISQPINKYEGKISDAKIKDFQRKHNYYDINSQGEKEYWSNFMDEVCAIAAADIARDSSDTYATEIAEILIRQYGVSIPTPEGKSATQEELYGAIKKGMRFFMGADMARMTEINEKLEQGRDNVQKVIINAAVFIATDATEKEKIAEVFAKYDVKLPKIEGKKSSRVEYRRKFTVKLQKLINKKIDEAKLNQFYGDLWKVMKDNKSIAT